MRRVALVTGGSRGIGAACVELLARQGWSVAFFSRGGREQTRLRTEALRGEGLDVSWYACDISSLDEVQSAMARVLSDLRHIDLLVNNAAIAQIGLFTDTTEEQWRRMFAVNVDGAYRCTRAVLPGMIGRGKGAIVNISSMWGEVGASCEVAYSASKAALIGMTKALAKELGPSGVRVNCITPGVIDTDMNAALDADTRQTLMDETPLGRLGTPEEVARAVAFLAGEEASFITGQVLGVSGGFVI